MQRICRYIIKNTLHNLLDILCFWVPFLYSEAFREAYECWKFYMGRYRPAAKPQSGGPGSILLGLPCPSQDDPVLRGLALAFTLHPWGSICWWHWPMFHQLKHFLDFAGYTYSTSVQPPKQSHQPFILLLYQGLVPALGSTYVSRLHRRGGVWTNHTRPRCTVITR